MPNGEPVCPRCGSLDAYDCRRFKGAPRFRCKGCKKDFSITAGTFASHKLPLRCYFAARSNDSLVTRVFENGFILWAYGGDPPPRRAGLASTLIANGESLPYIAAQLGHHSPAFTLAVYGHLMPSATGRGVDRLDDLAGRP